MATVKFGRGNKTNIDSTSIVDGQILTSVDTKDIYIDIEDERIKITDIIYVSDVDDLEGLEDPQQGKIYYVESENDFYIYTGVKFENVTAVDAQHVTIIIDGEETTIEKIIEQLEDALKNELSDIDDLTEQVNTNTENIATNKENIAANTTAIEGLEETVTNKEHFKGYFATIAEIEMLTGEKGDFAYCAEDGYKYVYDETENKFIKTDEKVPDQTVEASDSTPLMDGTATAGTGTKYAREDHVHPTDTTRASQEDLTALQAEVKDIEENPYDDTELRQLISEKVDKEEGKGLSTNDFTDSEKSKLDELENYTLPTASSTVLGGIKVGENLTITDGVLSADAQKVDVATETSDGLMSAEDKTKLDGLENYDDTEVKESISENASKIAEIEDMLTWIEL